MTALSVATASATATDMPTISKDCYKVTAVTNEVYTQLLRTCGTDTCLQDWTQELSNCTSLTKPGPCRSEQELMCCRLSSLSRCSMTSNLVCLQDYYNTTWYVAQTQQNIMINTTTPINVGDHINYFGLPCTKATPGDNSGSIALVVFLVIIFLAMFSITMCLC